MNQEWGRNQYAGEWPNPKAAWTLAALLFAAASMAAICAYRYSYVLTPLQRFYLRPYIRSGLRTEIGVSKTDRYMLLNVVDRRGSRLALNEEVAPVASVTGEATFSLTDEAVRIGDQRLVFQQGQYDNAKLHAFLGHWIYRDQSFTDFLRPALWGGLGVFFVGLLVAIPKDAARARARKEGRRLKGPELVTVRDFNRRNRSDGIRFEQKQSFLEKTFGRVPTLRPPRAIEPSHILIMGDTGTGKSTLIRRILLQIEERGDAILNPLDARMPYWSPGEELRNDAEALTFAASLFPDRHNENPFFVEGPRKIFAHLLTFRPTPEELAWWMCHEDESGGCVGVLLIGIAAIARVAVTAQCRIYLDDRRFASRYQPAVKRPEMHSISNAHAYKTQPRNAGMGGFGDRSRHIKVKYRFRARTHFRNPPPARITTTSRTVPTSPIPNEIDVSVVLICRPMLLKIV